MSLTDRPLRGFLQLGQQMAHCLVEVMLRKCLRVVYSKRGNEGNDHLANMGVPMRLEIEDLLCGIEEVLPHELWN